MWWMLRDVPTEDLHQALGILQTTRSQLAEALQPAPDERWAEVLGKIAQMLNVSLPNADGLALYLAVLRKVPGHLLNTACTHVAETHRYNTMPKPADFIDAVAAENSRLRILASVHETAMRNVGRALSHRQKDQANGVA